MLREPDGRGGSAFVHDELAVGDLVGVGGPRNNFPLVPSEQYLFVAGGIGITPLLPMIAQADLLGADWRLLYGGRRRARWPSSTSWPAYGDRVQVVPQDEHGLLDLAGFLGEPRPGVRVYACGPAPLLAAMEAACAGWPPHTCAPSGSWPTSAGLRSATPPFEVELARTGDDGHGDPGHDGPRGARPRSASRCCRPAGGGSAAPARPTVLDGRPDHRDALLDDDERDAADCMYVCVSRSCTDRLVLDL